MKDSFKIINLSFAQIRIGLEWIGEDVLLIVSGGERPHIGCTVMSVPRPSLTGDGATSCTSSVLNLTGHMDEGICRVLAEKACRAFGRTTVCTGGFHKDSLTPEELAEIQQAVKEFEF